MIQPMGRVTRGELETREVDATPYAASLIEGHRDFGYSLETVLADIIDNAITAGARTVELIADTVADEPWIALADDGSPRNLAHRHPGHTRLPADHPLLVVRPDPTLPPPRHPLPR